MDALDADERAELEQLRAEVSQLRASVTSDGNVGGPPRRQRRRWGRGTAAAVLITISCALAPLSVAAVWARGEVTDTDRYVATVAPLADDPAIQEAITTNITNIVFQYIDVQGLTEQAFSALAERGSLPPNISTQLEALAVPIANGVRSYAESQVSRVVESEAFARAWTEAHRSAHEQLVAALTGEGGGGVVIEGNAVRLNLAAFVDVVKQRLLDSGFELAARIPAVNASFVVFESANVGRIQQGFDLLNTLGLWLPFILVPLAALGIYLAPDHRLAFIFAGLGVALAMFVAGVALLWLRRAYLDGVPPDVLPLPAAETLYDTVVRFLREAVRAAFLIGLVVAAGAFLTGPSVTATTVRRWLVSGFAVARGGLKNLGVGLEDATRWGMRYAGLLRGLVVGAAFVVLLVERYRTPELVMWLTIGVLAGLAVIQFFATEPRPVERSPDLSRAAAAET
jgi:hypothetical protein